MSQLIFLNLAYTFFNIDTHNFFFFFREKSSFLKKLESTLEKQTYICSDSINIADIFLMSAVQQLDLNTKVKSIQRWINTCLKYNWGITLM